MNTNIIIVEDFVINLDLITCIFRNKIAIDDQTRYVIRFTFTGKEVQEIYCDTQESWDSLWKLLKSKIEEKNGE